MTAQKAESDLRGPSSKGPPHLVHITPGFGPGGAQVRTVQIINFLGDSFRHTIVSLDGSLGAVRRIHSSIDAHAVAITQRTRFMVPHFTTLFRSVQPSLVLTYNWGSIDAVIAATLLRSIPIIHSEDGFGSEEATRQKARRVLIRRFVLPHVYRTVAPSKTLIRVMENQWKLPSSRIQYIPNGVDTQGFTPRCEGDRSTSDSERITVGTVGHLRGEKRQTMLAAACAATASTRPIQLMIVGSGPDHETLAAKARSLDISGIVKFLGHQEDVCHLYHEMDIFALTSETEQMPLTILEAMACGLPVVSTDVGDVRHMLCTDNAPFVVSTFREFTSALLALIDRPDLRKALGDQNRACAVSEYQLSAMLQQYRSLYLMAMQSRLLRE